MSSYLLKSFIPLECHHEIALGQLRVCDGSRYGKKIVTADSIRCTCGAWNSKYRSNCWKCGAEL